MKRLIALVVVAAGALTLRAAAWRGLTEAGYYSGPKLTEDDLDGKVVLVDCWGVNCPPCRALLPRMEQIWQGFKSKPFVLLGSHCQGRAPEKVAELVKANKLTCPIYDFAGLAQGEGPRLLLSAVAQCLGCYALWTFRVRLARLLLVVVSLLWLVYDVLAGSIPGTLCEVLSQISLYVAIARDARRAAARDAPR